MRLACLGRHPDECRDPFWFLLDVCEIKINLDSGVRRDDECEN
jgi:hypothetical protein